MWKDWSRWDITGFQSAAVVKAPWMSRMVGLSAMSVILDYHSGAKVLPKKEVRCD
jgi:hypothetical protein